MEARFQIASGALASVDRTTIVGASVRAITARVSAERYDGNVYADITTDPEATSKSVRLRFVLRCHSSKGPGARRSYSGRRTVAATWEAHEHVLRALFHHWGDALRIRTALATYDGPEDFEEKYRDTYSVNVGTQIAPAMIGEL